MGSKEYIVGFTPNDRKRFYIETKRGKVIRFVVQFETFINEEWHPVVRYDTVHGYAHKDILERNGRVIEKVKIAIIDYKKALQIAILDIDSNWRIYKQRFSKGR
ncbi:MAG: DUF7718 family protein [Thermodesulfobacteriota bacterium]